MSEQSTTVTLHVYDLSQGLARQLSHSFLGKAIDAIYHTGIVVYGREYWFGGGIETGVPGQTYFGPPMQRIVLGRTEIPKEVFEEFLQDIRPNYTQATYSLLTHNCNNFSDELAQFLVGKGIPSNILNLPQEVLSSPQGALLMPMLQQLETSLRNRSVPQPPHLIGSTLPAHPSYPPASVPQPPPVAATPPAPRTIRASQPPASPAVPVGPSDSQPINTSSTLSPGTAAPAPAASPGAHVKVPPSAAAAHPGGSGQPSGAAQEALDRAKQQLHAEVSREFAAIMAAGGMEASAAAVVALQRVMARRGTATAASVGQ